MQARTVSIMMPMRKPLPSMLLLTHSSSWRVITWGTIIETRAPVSAWASAMASTCIA